MKLFKKGFMLAACMLMFVLSATPVFAAKAESNSCTTPASLECAVYKALGPTDFSESKGSGYEYDVQITFNGSAKKIYLLEKPTVDDISVNMKSDGKLDINGIGTGDSNQWNNLFAKYRTVIVGISGIGAISMIVFFIMNFMKLGASAGNPQARSQALTGVLWTGLAAAGLGAVRHVFFRKVDYCLI